MLPTVLRSLAAAAAIGLAAPLSAQCTAEAGTLTPEAVTANAARDSFFLRAFRNGDRVVPEGFEDLYLLTRVRGDSLIVAQASVDPFFGVTEIGTYGVHHLVAETSDPASADYVDSGVLYPPGRLLSDVAATFDGDICGAVDSEGIRLRVASDTGLDCGDAIDVGTLTPEFTQVVAGGDSVAIRVARDEPATVPGELELRYVLTRGSERLVVAIGASPRFVVPAADTGVYSTHTFIAELDDSDADNYFDPGTIQPGVTTVDDIANRYAQEGLCARIDGAGAQSFVIPLTGSCPSEAGTLTASAKTVNAAGDTAVLRAARAEVAFLPEDYELLYVLTVQDGTDLRILAVDNEPSFGVDAAGEYRIHTLVAETDTSVARSLDLSIVEFGVTTAADVIAAARAADACFDLDAEGASFSVAEGELMSTSVRDLAPAADGLRAYQSGAEALVVAFAPASGLGDRAQVTLRDGLGRTVAARLLTDLRAGREVRLELPTSSVAGGFYVVTVSGGSAQSSRAVVLR